MINRWNLISDLILSNQYKSIIEVGVSKGSITTQVRKILAEKRYPLNNYYGVDPFLEPYYAMDDETKTRLIDWGGFRLLEYKSDEALQYIGHEVDLIFIDGSHDEMQMCKDIINYGDKLKCGGCLVGHDFLNPLLPKVTSYLETIMGKEINIIQDKRDENGKPNYLWWTYKVEEGVYAKIRPNLL